jgi:hypothetical protein
MQGHERKAFELLIPLKENIKKVLNVGIVNLPHKMYEIDTVVRILQHLNITPNVTHLEIFERNCEIGKQKYPTNKFVQGDVRNVQTLIQEKFDFIFWWHGPEHVYEHELIPTITALESLLEQGGVIILGSPNGWQEQHNEDGNIHNDHYSGPDTPFYQSLGYEVYKEWDDAFWSLIAYKRK